MITIFILSWAVMCSDGLTQYREIKFDNLELAEQAKFAISSEESITGCRETNVKLVASREKHDLAKGRFE